MARRRRASGRCACWAWGRRADSASGAARSGPGRSQIEPARWLIPGAGGARSQVRNVLVRNACRSSRALVVRLRGRSAALPFGITGFLRTVCGRLVRFFPLEAAPRRATLALPRYGTGSGARASRFGHRESSSRRVLRLPSLSLRLRYGQSFILDSPGRPPRRCTGAGGFAEPLRRPHRWLLASELFRGRGRGLSERGGCPVRPRSGGRDHPVQRWRDRGYCGCQPSCRLSRDSRGPVERVDRSHPQRRLDLRG